MPDFTYEALADTGQRSHGHADRQQRARGDGACSTPAACSPCTIDAGQGPRRPAAGAAGASRAAHMADLLLAAGRPAPLRRAAAAQPRTSSNGRRRSRRLAEVLREVRAKVADGTSLAEAMAQHPNAFNELAVSMVRAGQEGGFLEDVLKRIADFTEHQEDLKAKVIGALAYPVFLAVVGFIVLNVLVIFFVPQVRADLQEARRRRASCRR